MQESFSHHTTIRRFLALSSRYFLDGRASAGEGPLADAGFPVPKHVPSAGDDAPPTLEGAPREPKRAQ